MSDDRKSHVSPSNFTNFVTVSTFFSISENHNSDKDGQTPEKDKSKESEDKPKTPESQEVDNSPHGQQVQRFVRNRQLWTKLNNEILVCQKRARKLMKYTGAPQVSVRDKVQVFTAITQFMDESVQTFLFGIPCEKPLELMKETFSWLTLDTNVAVPWCAKQQLLKMAAILDSKRLEVVIQEVFARIQRCFLQCKDEFQAAADAVFPAILVAIADGRD